MRIRFSKMHGAGNDFVVLDETRGRLGLTPAHYQRLADRRLGIGCDQILSVRAASTNDVDFDYAIHNADGGEVEQCGNGARCFAAFVRQQGLSGRDTIRVRTRAGVIAPHIDAQGRVTVDMGAPAFEPGALPFDTAGLAPADTVGSLSKWPLTLGKHAQDAIVYVAVVSMGNPHAVQVVDDVDTAPVATVGPCIERHPRFARRVNAGFMQVVGRDRIRLRVYERGAGETLACGTGACAAVVAGIRLGLLDARVAVETRGGGLAVAWQGAGQPVFMSGPAVTVFTGTIELPDTL